MITWFGVFLLWLAWRTNNPVVRLTPNRILAVLGINVLVISATGIISIAIFGSPKVGSLDDVALWQGLFAGFEDCVFVLPALMLEDKIERRAWLLLGTLLFTSGHSYQGNGAMFAKLFVVPVVYLMASEWGILTTMAAHSLMDVTSLTILRLVRGH